MSTTKEKVSLFTAEELIAYRRSLGLTQEEFALKTGTALGTLRNWEQGLCIPNISIEKFKLINKILAFKKRKKKRLNK